MPHAAREHPSPRVCHLSLQHPRELSVAGHVALRAAFAGLWGMPRAYVGVAILGSRCSVHVLQTQGEVNSVVVL